MREMEKQRRDRSGKVRPKGSSEFEVLKENVKELTLHVCNEVVICCNNYFRMSKHTEP